MGKTPAQSIAAALVVLMASAACSHHATKTRPPIDAGEQKSIHQPTPEEQALGIYQPYSDADINFMTGMIPHHAQAVVMSGWAPSHGARFDVAILCERIVVGQNDEIRSMQTWLSDRN